MPEHIPHVVIVGGGFGGLAAARALARAKVRITIIDRENHHCFQPLLYEVATAALSAPDIAAPIRRIFTSHRNVEVLMGEVVDIDTEAQQVLLAGDAIDYDYLILASGATHSYFGKDEWSKHAPGLKTLDDALEIRRRFLLAFESAEREANDAARRAHLTFVVVGAGPTGVELAGTMSEIARRAIPKDFRSVDTTTARVILVEARNRVLPGGFDDQLCVAAKRSLEQLGVDVRLNSMVTEIDSEGVVIDNQERIDAANVFWAAGVAASSLGAALGAPLDRSGRVNVEPDLRVPQQSRIFVIGDLAHLVDAETRQAVPGVAPAAIQMGRHVAKTIKAAVENRPQPGPFKYRDKGIFATIGRARAVGRVGAMRFTGLPAWLAWATIHIVFLIGFANRIIVTLRWAWAYIVFRRGARLIMGDARVKLRSPRGSVFDGREERHNRADHKETIVS